MVNILGNVNNFLNPEQSKNPNSYFLKIPIFLEKHEQN